MMQPHRPPTLDSPRRASLGAPKLPAGLRDESESPVARWRDANQKVSNRSAVPITNSLIWSPGLNAFLPTTTSRLWLGSIQSMPSRPVCKWRHAERLSTAYGGQRMRDGCCARLWTRCRDAAAPVDHWLVVFRRRVSDLRPKLASGQPEPTRQFPLQRGWLHVSRHPPVGEGVPSCPSCGWVECVGECVVPAATEDPKLARLTATALPVCNQAPVLTRALARDVGRRKFPGCSGSPSC